MSYYIHPSVICETDKIGENSRIWTFSHIQEGVEIGTNVNIGGHCFIESGSKIGDGTTIKNGVSIWRNIIIGRQCFIGPNAVFTNDLIPRSFNKKHGNQLLYTYVEDFVTIGANATINPGLVIGESSLIASGSVIIKNINKHSKVAGNPAKQIGWICKCGNDILNFKCHKCKIIYDENEFGLYSIN